MQSLNLQFDLINRNNMSHIYSSSDVILQSVFITFKEGKKPNCFSLEGSGSKSWGEMSHCLACIRGSKVF